jgi:hypothetical protein
MAVTRREFLKFSCLTLASLATSAFGQGGPWLPEEPPYGQPLGRVTRRSKVHSEPDILSPALFTLQKDDLVTVLEGVDSPVGPAENPRWHRLAEGYLHSAYVQHIDGACLNRPLESIPVTGRLGEVTVPYTQVELKSRKWGLMPLYRLYYGSVHWIIGTEWNDLGEQFYWLMDDWLWARYRVRAEHIRPIPWEALAPLSTEIPPQEKKIHVSLERQLVTVYESGRVIREMRASTGRRYTSTPAGDFAVDRKHPSRHMGDGYLTSDLRAYELVGVPWVSFFHKAGIAFHGTFWHDNYGTPMSMGCVNLPIPDALWIYRWTKPVYTGEAGDRPAWKITGTGGTNVTVT